MMGPQPELEVTWVPVDELLEYEGNAKLHPSEQVDQIASSIEEFSFADPIGAWHDDDGNAVIVEGHGRLLAARKLGIEQLPVIFLDYLSDEQRRAYALVHNQLTMNSGFDFDVLSDELESITDMDMSTFGFVQDAIDEMGLDEDGTPSSAEVPFSLELGQQSNYIVLVFNNDIDWINAQSVFNIGQRKRFSTRKDGFLGEKMQHYGVGRVIDGAEAINALIGD